MGGQKKRKKAASPGSASENSDGVNGVAYSPVTSNTEELSPHSSPPAGAGAAAGMAQAVDSTTSQLTSDTAASFSTGEVSPMSETSSSSDPVLAADGSFVVIKPVSDGVSFRKLNVFWPSKQLFAICGLENGQIQAPANGTLIVKTRSRLQTTKLLQTAEFCGKSVSVTLHQSRNYSQGIIWAPGLRHMSDADLLSDLRAKGVTGVRRITTVRDGQRRDTSLIILTFGSVTLPQEINIGYLHFDVEVFVPNPLRCFNCQRYGHGINSCHYHPARCSRCGEAPHGEAPCLAPQHCLSCQSTDHPTTSKNCPIWQREKEVCSVKVKTGVSWQQARREVVAASVAGSKTYSQICGQSTNTSVVSTQTEDLPQLPPLTLLSPRPSPVRASPLPTTRTSETQTPVAMSLMGNSDMSSLQSTTERAPSNISSSATSARQTKSPRRRSRSPTRTPHVGSRPHTRERSRRQRTDSRTPRSSFNHNDTQEDFAGPRTRAQSRRAMDSEVPSTSTSRHQAPPPGGTGIFE